MNSNFNNENSSETQGCGLKNNKKRLFNNDNDFCLSEISTKSELDSQKIENFDKFSKLGEKTKDFSKSQEKKGNIYQTMFNESSLNSFASKNSKENLSLFDSNSKFSQKNLTFLKSPKSKVDSIDTWACKDSKIFGKIGLNSALGNNFTNTFNDSALFLSSN